MGGSELIYRGHEDEIHPKADASYMPKPLKPWSSVTRLIRYMLREQRLVFVAIATHIFTVLPRGGGGGPGHNSVNNYISIADSSYSYFPSESNRSSKQVGFEFEKVSFACLRL